MNALPEVPKGPAALEQFVQTGSVPSAVTAQLALPATAVSSVPVRTSVNELELQRQYTNDCIGRN